MTGIRCGGFDQCMPTTRPGTRVTDASSVIGIPEVLEARITSSPTCASRSLKTCCLSAFCSGTVSTTKLGSVERCREIRRGGDARPSGVGVLRGHETAAGQGGVDEVDRASRLLQLLRFHIVERGIETIAGERRRHAGAHRAGADDGDFLNRVLGHHVLSFVKRPLSTCLSIHVRDQCMLMPPPMLIAAPLMKAASSETRKTISPLTSSGFSKRPIGV